MPYVLFVATKEPYLMIKIFCKLDGNVNTASTRIRHYRLLPYFSDNIQFNYMHDDNCDLLYIQKTSKDNVIGLAKQFISRGKAVVYDVDVAVTTSWDDNKKWLIKNASVVVVNNMFCWNHVVAFYPQTRLHYIEDCIDYVEKEDKIEIRRNPRNIVSFWNNPDCARHTFPYFHFCSNKYNKAYISGERDDLFDVVAKFIKWDLNGFVDVLKQQDFCVIVHPESDYGNAKSTNRLNVAMAMGIPCVVSNTHAYAVRMKELGLDYLIAHKPDDVGKILKKLKGKEIRTRISNIFRKYVWEKLSPQLNARKMENLFNELIEKRRN